MMKKLRLNFKDALSYKEHMMRAKQKFKAASIGFAVTTIICASIPKTYASDIEIYKIPPNSTQSTTLMLMLDLSGSMGPYSGSSYSFSDYGILNSDHCNNEDTTDGNNLGSFTSRKTYHINSTVTPTYRRNFCYISTTHATNDIKGIQSDGTTDLNKGCEPQKNAAGTITGYRCYDRLTRLKDGLYQALQGTATVPKVKDEIIVGLSTFTGNNGVIRVPARSLSEVLGSYKVQVTKTRIVYDEVPVYENQSYEVTPAHQRSYWRRKTTSANNSVYRYQTCTWDTVNRTCTSWSSWSNNATRPNGFPNPAPGTYSTKACPSGSTYDFNCLEYYLNVPAVMGTRPVQVGTQQIPRTETYTEEETRYTTQRDALLETMTTLSAGGGTPTPYAYAEAAAYLMGTRTTAPVTWRRVVGNAASDDTGYYTGCNSESNRVLIGTGVNAGETLPAIWCANWSNGNTPAEVRDPQNYNVFFYVSGNSTRKAYYQRGTSKVVKNQIGNSASNNSGYWKCNTSGTAYTSYTGAGVDVGKILIINSCSSETNTNLSVPNTVTGNASYKVFNYEWGNATRKMFYTEAIVSLPSAATENADPYTGWGASVSTVKDIDNNKYIAPTSITRQKNFTDEQKKCNGQGIYFLTDGEPTPSGVPLTATDGRNGTEYSLMQSSLGDKADIFNCANSSLGQGDVAGYYNGANSGWKCIGKYAQALFDKTKNPTGLKIQTAVVGFGNRFGSTTPTNDIADAQKWGQDSTDAGKYYKGASAKDVADSINNFVEGLNDKIPSLSTGSSTIPIDALNPAAVQPYSYFPQFEPKVKAADRQQVWFGNLKKYYVLNNSVYSSQTADEANIVVKKSSLQDLADIWAKGGITYPENTPVFRKGGALSQLPLGTSTNVQNETTTARNLLTDYSYDGTKAESERVNRDFDLVKINYTYTSNDKTKTDTIYASALMSLLGYNIPSDTSTNGLDLSTQTAEVRQMGSIMHSNPVLLTQEGKATATKDSTTGKISVGSTGREDYVLFGTTQGLVQVVDATTGVEKFAFVPKEIIERQSETFKNGGGNLAGGKEALYYGVDGEWTAHTVYVTKRDGTLTVKGTAKDIADSEEKENLSGKQWVYGGMRMGGRSYYALDLTNIDSPKIKFHIDPSTSKVYNKDNPSGTTYAALAKMGQSWSKPTLGYVNWKGKRKLVMFVGGGYDAGGDSGDGLYAGRIRTGYAGYETYNYNQDNKIGAGVYMFDADNGDLLWNADSDSNSELKYSVASQIRAIDRNNDGVIDHVYFGDLAGQAFRVDFKNDGSKTAFTAQTNRVLNLHQTDGTSPRFYTLPVFTAHNSAGSEKIYGGNIVLVTFVSGNKSSPLLATSDSPHKKDSSGLQYDGVYAIYDYDVYPSTNEGRYPSSHMAARTLAATTMTDPSANQLRYINDATTTTTIDRDSGWGGWYYLFNKKFDNSDGSASIIKALTNPIALEGSLYVTQFDASNNGTTSSCGAGVKGNSFAQRLCLPTGVCKEDANYRYNLGSGIVTLNVGGGTDNDPYKRSLVVPDPNDVCTGTDCKTCKGDDCDTKKDFLNTGGALKFIPNRWYEKYARQERSS